jgi:hypothetical protein
MYSRLQDASAPLLLVSRSGPTEPSLDMNDKLATQGAGGGVALALSQAGWLGPAATLSEYCVGRE